MDLRINSNFGQLGYNYTPTQLEIYAKPVKMEPEFTPAIFNIHSGPSQINIDYTETRADIGYKGIVALENESAKKGQATVLDGISRRAQEGYSLADSIGKGTKIIGNIAFNNTIVEKEFNYDAIPHVPPKIMYKRGSVNIDYAPANIKFQVGSAIPIIDVIPGKVNIFLEKKPDIQIEAVGSYLDLVI